MNIIAGCRVTGAWMFSDNEVSAPGSVGTKAALSVATFLRYRMCEGIGTKILPMTLARFYLRKYDHFKKNSHVLDRFISKSPPDCAEQMYSL